MVVVLGAYIYFYERHQLTTEELQERAEKVLPGLEQDSVSALSITNAGKTVRLRKIDDAWRITEPIDYPADQGKVTSLLSSLQGLTAKRRLSTAEVDPGLHGLDDPQLRVTLTTDAGETELRLGSEAALGSQRAVAVGGDEILMCDVLFVADLERGVDEWRSRKVLDIRSNDLATLDVETPSDRLSLAQLDGTWRVVEPVTDLADEEHVRNLITSLNSLEVKEFATPGESDDGLGLDPPRYRVTLGVTSGDQPTILELGATKTVDGAVQVACRRQGELLGWVSDSAESALGRAPIRWRARTVYPFDSWEVTRLSISRAQETVTLEREQGLWRLEDGTEVESTPVSERLTTLAHLQALEYDLVDPQTAEHGRIELWLNGFGQEEEPEQVSFTFAEPMASGGNYLVTVSGRDTRMSVAGDQVASLFADLEQLETPALPPPSDQEQAPSDEE